MERRSVGETVVRQLAKTSSVVLAGIAAICLFLTNGCGNKNTANVVSVTVTPASDSLILGQSVTLTATVGGATNTNVTWSKLQYTTTTTTNGKTTTSSLTDAPTDGSFGALSNAQTSTITYTAPDPSKFSVPDPTKFPGLQLVITATSVQDTKKTGKSSITLISGIRATLTPVSASVPTGEPQDFRVSLTNDVQNKNVTWLLTQNIPNTDSKGNFINYPQLPKCDPTCGSFMVDPNDPNHITYTAPTQIPTAITPAQKNNTNPAANVTVVATSNADNNAFVIGSITITPGGPITFNGISPTIAPQNATLWDIYLDAPNISSASQIFLTYGSSTNPVKKTSDSGQIKILFPVPTSSSSTTTTTTTTCTATSPCSTGARLRLFASDLATAGPVTVTVVDPAQPCNTTVPPLTQCAATGTSTFNIIPVRATSTATVPDDIVLGSQTQNFGLTIDGGYFGPNGSGAAAFFQSPANPTLLAVPAQSNSRQLTVPLPANDINPSNPGLYPLYVRSNSTNPAPSPGNPSVTNMALFPDYSSTNGTIAPGASVIPTGTNPSAVDIDPDLGVLVVAEAGSNTVEFFSIGNGTLTSLGQVASTSTAPINVPTGVSVNRTNHTVAVVNYGSQTITKNTDGTCQSATLTGQSVTVLNIPGSPSPITPFSVDLTAPFLSSAGQGTVCPVPMPYSIGVDPDSNFALVAYSTSQVNAITSASNLGFIVNLNPNTQGSTPGIGSAPCALSQALSASSNQFGQCLFAQVTLNNGTYPQIAVAPHGHRALVTPGGSGVVMGIDVTRPSTANVVKSASLAAGLVTVTVDTTQCPPGVTGTGSKTNPCPLLMVPGNAGSVLISGVQANTPANNVYFNGVFSVSVISNNSFTYSVNNLTVSDSAGCTTATPPVCGTVFYGSPQQTFGLPTTSQGIAINPITSTAAIADANTTGTNGAQINLLNGLDQSVSSISFFATCTAFTTTCTGAPELLATTNVAWQPFTNELVSYNPKQALVSISDPVSRRRYALVNLGASSPSAMPFPVSNGTSNTTLTLWGGIAVDPVTNQAFVAESGQAPCSTCTPATTGTPGQIQIVSLAAATAIKPTHISEVLVPSPSSAPGNIGGIPKALVPQATLTSTSALAGVKIFGSGFASGMQVLLDGTDITTTNPAGSIDSISPGGREVDVTIPPAFLAAPHHYALTVVSNGAQSNALDFIVVQQVDLSNVCTNPSNGSVMPSSVAIADQIANGPFSPFALVSVTGCNSVVRIDLNPASATFGQLIGSPITVGTSPQGIAIWQRKGLVVVANNGGGTASVIDLTQSPVGPALCAAPSGSTGTVPCADVSTGTNPSGVAINEATGAALVANTGSNTVTMINLGLLFPQPNATLPSSLTPVSIGGIQEPTAVAIDPDRGTNNQGIAVVSAVQLNSGLGPSGALSVVEIGTATPALSTTISSGFVSSTPTGVVFDPAVVTNTTNPGVFFANSSGTNAITEFNPDTGGGTSVSVGINPTSLAINPQTGAMLTANSASNTISIVDTISSPFKTHQTLGIPGSPTFGVAIDQFTNLAVIVDQANMRVLLFPMPN